MDIHPYYIIIPTGLLLGILAGFIMHRSDFCVAGMFRDIFLFKDTKKVKSLTLLVVTSMVLFEAARLAGLLPLYPFPLLGYPSVANIIGGFVFGIGMVLAGGCVVGVLYKIGSGNMISLTALAGMIAGSALYAEIHPLWAAFIKKTTIVNSNITLTKLTGIDPFVIVLLILIPAVLYLLKWRDKGDFKVDFAPEGYISLTRAALLLSAIGLLSYVVLGMPFGITTYYAKSAGYIMQFIMPEHFNEVEFYKLITLRYNYPLTGQPLVGGPSPIFDAISALQMPVIAGIIIGSFISSLSLKEFTVYLNQPAVQYVSAFIGGILVGLASRLTPGCNIWHIFGGLPIFAMQSMLFLIGLLPGAWLGSKVLVRLVLR